MDATVIGFVEFSLKNATLIRILEKTIERKVYFFQYYLHVYSKMDEFIILEYFC